MHVMQNVDIVSWFLQITTEIFGPTLAKAMWDVTVYIDEDGGGYGPSHTLIRELRDKFATVSAHDGSQDGAAP